MSYEAVVMGVSSGGMQAMKVLFSQLPKHFPAPIIVVQHIGAHSDSTWISILNNNCKLTIKEADEKEVIKKGFVYIAPPNYHLLVEKDKTFSLSVDEKVNFARPAIDVLFETAAEAYNDKLIGVILTGSNHDGTQGMKKIKEYGGLTIAEDPATATSPFMPASAINAMQPEHIVSLENIVDLLINITTPACPMK